MNRQSFLFMAGMWLFGHAQAQEITEDWLVTNILGPSQVGVIANLPIDHNGDDLTDVLSVSYSDGHLRAYINNGDLTFDQDMLSTDFFGAYRLNPGHVNEDQVIDYLIPSLETQEIAAWVSTPTGYIKQVIAKDVLLPTDAMAADFDGNGLNDVVSLSFEEDLVLLHSQTSPGVYSDEVIAIDVLGPRKMVVADFDLDQDQDILVATSEDMAIRMFVNDGSANFSVNALRNDLDNVRFIAPCDANGDQLLDFVAAVHGETAIYLFTNTGSNNFSASLVDDDLLSGLGLSCADIDGDQQQELISISSAQGNIYTHELFDPQAKSLIANNRDGHVTTAVAEFQNGNGLSLLTQSFFENRNVLYAVDQANQDLVVWEDFPDGAYFIEAIDVDADGDTDVVGTSFRNDTVFWLSNQQGQFTYHEIQTSVDGPQSVFPGDLDGDGDVDLIVAGAFDDIFWVHHNDGSGQFSTEILLADANNAARSHIADINGDQLADIVLTSSLDDSVRLMLQDAQGAFTVQLLDDDMVGAFEILVVDFDEDGLLDIVVTGLRDTRVKLYQQQLSGGFTTEVVYNSAFRINVAQAIDLAGDDMVDLAFISDQQLITLLNQGGLAFQIIQSVIESLQIIEFVIWQQIDDQQQLVAALEAGPLVVANTQDSLSMNYLQIDNQFGLRALSASPKPSMLFAASSIDSSVKLVLKDLIMSSSFEAITKRF